jgi:hypothetical protein
VLGAVQNRAGKTAEECLFQPSLPWGPITHTYFIEGLGFEDGKLSFSSDYVSGRMMKTEIIYEPGGKVTLQTSNRGKSAERWLTHLQGKRHIQAVK